MRLADLRGRRVVVWGTGREGRAAVRAVAAVGPADLVAIQDRATAAAGAWTPDLAALAPLRTGDQARKALLAAEVLVRSPAIAQVHPWLQEARARGVTVTGGTSLWLADHAPATIGITGTKGKSTTASLTSHLLAGVGRPAVLGGNIGVAALDLPAADRYVLEMSAYQCADLVRSPAVVGLTSLFPEHLDWSGGEEEYYRDKLTVVAHGPQRVVYPVDDVRLRERLSGRDLPLLPVGTPESLHEAPGPDGRPWIHLADTPLLPRAALAAPGRHNTSNLCVALGVLYAAGVDLVADRERLHAAVASFTPLPHRLTPIEDPSGITFVDDSISTVPQSTVHAIEAFRDRPLTVLVGGQDRGVDYRPLRDYLAAAQVRATLIGMPENGPAILALLQDLPHVTTVAADDLPHAVALARRLTPPGGVVLLSPAAPSYDRFDNFEHRSRVFRQAVADTAG